MSGHRPQSTAQALRSLLDPTRTPCPEARQIFSAHRALDAARAFLGRVEPAYTRALVEDPACALDVSNRAHTAYGQALRASADARVAFLQAVADTNAATGLRLDPAQVDQAWPWF